MSPSTPTEDEMSWTDRSDALTAAQCHLHVLLHHLLLLMDEVVSDKRWRTHPAMTLSPLRPLRARDRQLVAQVLQQSRLHDPLVYGQFTQQIMAVYASLHEPQRRVLDMLTRVVFGPLTGMRRADLDTDVVVWNVLKEGALHHQDAVLRAWSTRGARLSSWMTSMGPTECDMVSSGSFVDLWNALLRHFVTASGDMRLLRAKYHPDHEGWVKVVLEHVRDMNDDIDVDDLEPGYLQHPAQWSMLNEWYTDWLKNAVYVRTMIHARATHRAACTSLPTATAARVTEPMVRRWFVDPHRVAIVHAARVDDDECDDVMRPTTLLSSLEQCRLVAPDTVADDQIACDVLREGVHQAGLHRAVSASLVGRPWCDDSLSYGLCQRVDDDNDDDDDDESAVSPSWAQQLRNVRRHLNTLDEQAHRPCIESSDLNTMRLHTTAHIGQWTHDVVQRARVDIPAHLVRPRRTLGHRHMVTVFDERCQQRLTPLQLYERACDPAAFVSSAYCDDDPLVGNLGAGISYFLPAHTDRQITHVTAAFMSSNVDTFSPLHRSLCSAISYLSERWLAERLGAQVLRRFNCVLDTFCRKHPLDVFSHDNEADRIMARRRAMVDMVGRTVRNTEYQHGIVSVIHMCATLSTFEVGDHTSRARQAWTLQLLPTLTSSSQDRVWLQWCMLRHVLSTRVMTWSGALALGGPLCAGTLPQVGLVSPNTLRFDAPILMNWSRTTRDMARLDTAEMTRHLETSLMHQLLVQGHHLAYDMGVLAAHLTMALQCSPMLCMRANEDRLPQLRVVLAQMALAQKLIQDLWASEPSMQPVQWMMRVTTQLVPSFERLKLWDYHWAFVPFAVAHERVHVALKEVIDELWYDDFVRTAALALDVHLGSSCFTRTLPACIVRVCQGAATLQTVMHSRDHHTRLVQLWRTSGLTQDPHPTMALRPMNAYVGQTSYRLNNRQYLDSVYLKARGFTKRFFERYHQSSPPTMNLPKCQLSAPLLNYIKAYEGVAITHDMRLHVVARDFFGRALTLCMVHLKRGRESSKSLVWVDLMQVPLHRHHTSPLKIDDVELNGWPVIVQLQQWTRDDNGTCVERRGEILTHSATDLRMHVSVKAPDASEQHYSHRVSICAADSVKMYAHTTFAHDNPSHVGNTLLSYMRNMDMTSSHASDVDDDADPLMVLPFPTYGFSLVTERPHGNDDDEESDVDVDDLDIPTSYVPRPRPTDHGPVCVGEPMLLTLHSVRSDIMAAVSYMRAPRHVMPSVEAPQACCPAPLADRDVNVDTCRWAHHIPPAAPGWEKEEWYMRWRNASSTIDERGAGGTHHGASVQCVGLHRTIVGDTCENAPILTVGTGLKQCVEFIPATMFA